MPAESGAGTSPTGYEYREYKNWRGIPKPKRCLFCKQVKGGIRKVRGGFQGYCPNCAATGPKRESYDDALRAWMGSQRWFGSSEFLPLEMLDGQNEELPRGSAKLASEFGSHCFGKYLARTWNGDSGF